MSSFFFNEDSENQLPQTASDSGKKVAIIVVPIVVVVTGGVAVGVALFILRGRVLSLLVTFRKGGEKMEEEPQVTVVAHGLDNPLYGHVETAQPSPSETDA